jgi:hypothetical protein
MHKVWCNVYARLCLLLHNMHAQQQKIKTNFTEKLLNSRAIPAQNFLAFAGTLEEKIWRSRRVMFDS